MGRAPEWRQDPLTERLVLISPERAERPLHPTGDCPFCEGRESETPPEVLAYREPGSAPNGPGWRVRVVPNRYAAVRLDVRRPLVSANGEPGVGVAEVFLESPRHATAFRNLSRSQAADAVRAWRDRLRFWRDDGRLAFALVFKNEGPAAGASVDHCHSQLIGIPFVPPDVANELEHLAQLRGIGGVCPFCQWVETGAAHERFVAESDRFAAFCPPAPRFPGEVWLLPKFHLHAFETLSEDKLTELAGAIQDLLARVDRAFDGPDFNLILKTPPFRHAEPSHWRIEILPRTTTTAGWEWGTGLLINTMFPERAAELLRAAT
jgi:UDPglucose--hexose-1-phosphate uridylyltransferase